MTLRVLAAGAALSLLAGPAWADCAAEIEALDETIVAAETGATTEAGSMPATKHQEEVLSGADPSDEEAADASRDAGIPATEHQQQVLSGGDAPLETGAGTSGADVEAASPHQREAVRELDEDTKTQASELIDEARELSAAGNEEGCQDKVTEAKALLGTE